MTGAEWLNIIIALAALAVPLIGIAMARDRSLLTMIQTAKDDAEANTKSTTDPIHDRINRIRDEFVRRDDLDGHLARWDKQFEGLRDDLRRASENTDRRLDEIRHLLQQPGK